MLNKHKKSDGANELKTFANRSRVHKRNKIIDFTDIIKWQLGRYSNVITIITLLNLSNVIAIASCIVSWRVVLLLIIAIRKPTPWRWQLNSW